MQDIHIQPDDKSTQVSQEGAKENPTDALIRMASVANLFLDQHHEPYASIESTGSKVVHKVGGKSFKQWLFVRYFEEKGTPPSAEAIRQTLQLLEAQAHMRNQVHPLFFRVAEAEGVIYYDLADSQWQHVQITQQGYQITREHPLLFQRTALTKTQVMPQNGGKLSNILNHLRIKNDLDGLLFMIYLVTCFIPNISHPALILSGEKGAAKTTTARMIRSIVDPSHQDIAFMPKGTTNLALSLSRQFMLSLDNMDTLRPETSDLLCMAVTGGSISKRKLFTDDDETVLSFKGCLTLNGIGVVANRSDFLDRAILLELERIDEHDRMEEAEIWRVFEADKPLILGAIFELISKAMVTYPEVHLSALSRMADFTRWGYAIAQAANVDGDLFLQAYEKNRSRINEEVMSSNPVATAICFLMEEQFIWEGSVSKLLGVLEQIALSKKINTRSRLWPRAAHVLSIRLQQIRSNLEEYGIYYDIRNKGFAKVIEIEKRES
ncbi:hypothetical protein [Paenibacillus sp. IHB B 3415]|uniref:hypothetical protein n=1 Tax=Paenibacillus sp. IHB B 3415 TaxID=867080 RepID=UPI00069970DC|nr:hypothetical protein [Paenibacillus sp. IHB B 3415]